MFERFRSYIRFYESYFQTHMNEKAEMSATGLVSMIFVAIIAAYMMPTAITAFFEANTTSFDPATAAIWGIIPLAMVIGLALAFFKGWI